MSRFFVTPEAVGSRTVTIDDRNDVNHIRKVLRLREGDEIDVSDGQEWEYRVSISWIDEDRVEADIIDKQKFAAEPRIDVTLFQGIPKQGKMELIVQKTVELGVHRIVPVFMERTVVTEKGNFGKKITRWQRVSAEAVKQCRRGIIPEVSDPVRMDDVIGAFGDFDLVLLPYENEDHRTIKDELRNIDREETRKIAVIIGPEGGFSEDEAERIKAAGGRPVTLGRTILRTETAGTAAMAMIMYELEL